MLCHFAIVFAQHLDNGHLTPLGWAVAVVYVLGALCCARARVTQQDGHRCSGKQQPWWVMAAILLFLGINKQLDLQTLLIDLGRATARTEGWYQYRRAAQVVFVVLFTLAVFAALTVCFKKWKWFVKEQPLVLAGILLLFLFVVLRASTINHIDERLRLRLYDEYWGWILELAGVVCIAWPAVGVKAR